MGKLYLITEDRRPMCYRKRKDLSQYIGQVAEMRGNAWVGFEFLFKDGTRLGQSLFYYESVDDK